MDIKKLGLISTVAMLSVTISLGGCDLLQSKKESKTEKIERLKSTWDEKFRKSKEAQAKRDEAERKFYELEAHLEKEYGSYGIYKDNEEYNKRAKDVREAKEEADKAYDESNAVWNKLSPYLPRHEFDTRNY
ncbi:hypothetical protein AP064_02870 [Candidatus Liberibacter solanacearum]|uniref:small effector proten n=1 Tax=Candidatus Liberibacter solanacearum TaxID=556287 RepID=UPI0006DCDC20|nr:small effector proten [Candidatus Liberibacter solanacearum]KQC49023.1 hypothetical protein AP064_02870 [Candidatus Liberibacter solanacearum]